MTGARQDLIERPPRGRGRRCAAGGGPAKASRRSAGELIERLDTTEGHWARQVDEARQALAAERKRLEATERAHAAEITRVRQALEATDAERGELTSALAEAREALTVARLDGEPRSSQEQLAKEAAKTLKDTQASSVRQLEGMQRQLQDFLERAPPRRRSRGP